MKYGESTFDILYLIFAIAAGIYLLCRAKSKTGKAMGIAAIVLGCGDAFHLVPRVLNYFIDSDFSTALGVGKLITSVTMTLFYVILFYIWIVEYKEPYSVSLSVTVTLLAVIRIVLCAFPQNGWFDNSNNLVWSIVRNIPFVILGAIICFLYFKKRKTEKSLYPIWIYVLLSFAFYIPVAVGASFVPLLGMLMLPKTVCYILMMVSFMIFVNKKIIKGSNTMKKQIKTTEAIFPMPVLLISTFNEDGTVDVMNAAWGTMLSRDMVALNLTETHTTVKNIKARNGFVVHIADAKHVVEADWFGCVHGEKVSDKFKKSGLSYEKSELVDAPIINELPIALECEFVEFQNDATGLGVIGKVLRTSVEEANLKDGKVDVDSLEAIAFDPYTHGYYKVGGRVGDAFKDGLKLK